MLVKGIRLLPLVVLLFLPHLAWAQISTGTIVGTVRDTSGAVIVGAQVTVRRVATNEKFETTSNNEGNYVVSPLRAGQYEIVVAISGFKTSVESGVKLEVGRTIRQDVTLSVGAVAERVEVTAAPPLLNTEKAEVGQVIDEDKIVSLPLNGRDFVNLATLSPGATPTRGQINGNSDTAGLNVRGNRRGANVITLDGGTYTSVDGFATFLPNIDALQEFQVKTGLYGAEYGVRPGGQIIAITKSGTNQLHGNLFWFHRNDNLNARSPFQSSKSEFKQNQWGGTLGGPIYIPGLIDGRDKAWFFVAYEGLYRRSFSNVLTTVPTAAEKSGQFTSAITDPTTGQPFVNNTIPSNRIDPAAQQLAAYWPDPNTAGSLNFMANSAANSHRPQLIARVDFNTSPSSRYWGRLIWDNDPGLAVSAIPIFSRKSPIGTRGVDITNSRTFGRVVNVASGHMFRRPRVLGKCDPALEGVAATLPIQNLTSVAINSICLPGVSVQGFLGFGGGLEGNVNVGNWEVKDDLSFQSGNHFLKTGAAWKRDWSFFLFAIHGSFSTTPRYTGNALADFLLGDLSSSSQGGDLQRGNNYLNNYYFYIQDDWKVTPKLTLNLGLRYELPLAWYDKRGFSTNFNLATGMLDPAELPLSPEPGASGRFPANVPLIEFSNRNFMPRVGLAYRVTEKTVVRSGYGIFSDLPDLNTGAGSLNQNPRTGTFGAFFTGDPVTPNLFLSNPFPIGQAGVGGVPEGFGAESPMPTTRSHSWGLSIERELLPSLLVGVGYQGSHTTNTIESVLVNDAEPSPLPVPDRRPYPNFSELGYGMGDGDAWYHGLELKVEKRVGKDGFYFLGAFTWAKQLDTVQSRLSGNIPADSRSYLRSRNMPIHLNKGRGESDVPIRVALTAGYELPFGPGKPYAREGVGAAIAGGWTIQGVAVFQRGYFFTVTLPGDAINTGSSFSQRPDLVGNPNLPPSERTPQRWFNTTAFAVPTGFVYGNAGRGIVEAPGINNFDFSIHRNFAITESQRLQFRAEFFNLANHPLFGAPGEQFGTPAYGVISTVINPRIIQLALKYYF